MSPFSRLGPIPRVNPRYRVLEAEGAEFINGEQEGVRLRKAKPEDAAAPTKDAPKKRRG